MRDQPNDSGRLAPARANCLRSTEVLARLGTSVLATVFFLLSFEGATRLLGVHFSAVPVRAGTREVAWLYDPRLGWRNRPHFTGQDYIAGPDRAAVRINSLGFRGPELGPKRRPRVAVFGDSFVFGTGVDEDHLFTTHLERLLAGSGHDYDVLNLGTNGFSTDQELLLFQELAARLRPDVVILVMCDNDFEANLEDFVFRRYYKPYFVLGSDGLVLRHQPVPLLSPSQRIKLWLGQRSEAWNFFRSRTRAGRPLFTFFQVGVPRRSSDDPIELTAALTVSFRDLAAATGARFLTLNTGHQGERTPLFQALRPRLARNAVPYLGLEANLAEGRAQHPELHWDFGLDRHWNTAAHRLAADVVHNYFKIRGWIPDP